MDKIPNKVPNNNDDNVVVINTENITVAQMQAQVNPDAHDTMVLERYVVGLRLSSYSWSSQLGAVPMAHCSRCSFSLCTIARTS
jgi:hypothetical protein